MNLRTAVELKKRKLNELSEYYDGFIKLLIASKL